MIHVITKLVENENAHGHIYNELKKINLTKKNMIITECRIIVTYKCQIRMAIAFHCPHNKFINQTRSYHMVGISIKIFMRKVRIPSFYAFLNSYSHTWGRIYLYRLFGTKLLMILHCLNLKRRLIVSKF